MYNSIRAIVNHEVTVTNEQYIMEHGTRTTFTIDIVLAKVNNQKSKGIERVLVEVDGPTHFVYDHNNEKRHLSGPTRYKHNMMQLLPYTEVLYVNSWEWNAAGTSPQEKKRFLTAKLYSRCSEFLSKKAIQEVCRKIKCKGRRSQRLNLCFLPL